MSRVALVTGGAKGIGESISRQLAAAGYQVVVSGRDQDALDSLVTDLVGGGHTAYGVAMDVGDPDSVRGAFGEVSASVGSLDLLVNCAGIIARGPAETYSDDDWLRVIRTDLNGAFWCSREAVGPMLESGSGAIVNVGSVVGQISVAGRASYSSAKAGLAGLTRSLALEWADRGVRVNTVAPGWTLTDMVRRGFETGKLDESALVSRIPMGRLASTDEIASVVLFLASESAAYLTGQVITVDGGYTINGNS